MRRIPTLLLCTAIASSSAAQAVDRATTAAAGGISAPGWSGRLEPDGEKRGAKLTDSRLAPRDGGLEVTTGPAAVFWSAANKAGGSFVVTATFAQAKAPPTGAYYGLFIGGSQLDRGKQNYLYCAIAGNGTFTVKHRLGGEEHELAGRTSSPAVRKSDADGRASNALALRVTPERTACLVNGTEVWSYPSRNLVGPGKLASVDGVVGFRVGADLDLHISGFTLGNI